MTMTSTSAFTSPIALSEIESVLAWVDTYKLSRPTKKINRDFSDAVLLAEILAVHYPKMVEMHNYPPRNSHALKLNNWLTLNRKVLRRLRLTLCCNTMEQLAQCAPGVIERVLLMVRDKIRRDEELNKSMKDAEHNVSSGGSYYEACGDDENVLVVPVKMRVNGVLETVQHKVVSHDSFIAMKDELKDAKDTTELLKQKVDHLDSLLKLKEERIEELQKQLDRKQSRRKDTEILQNSLQVPFETISPPTQVDDLVPSVSSKTSSLKSLKAVSSEPKVSTKEESKIPVPRSELSTPKITPKQSLSHISVRNHVEVIENYNLGVHKDKSDVFNEMDVDKVKSDVFKEIELIEMKNDGFQDEEFKDSEQEGIITIEDTIQNEVRDLCKPMDTLQDNYLN